MPFTKTEEVRQALFTYISAKLTGENLAVVSSVEDSDVCALECLKYEQCGGFQHEQVTLTCSLLDKTRIDVTYMGTVLNCPDYMFVSLPKVLGDQQLQDQLSPYKGI